MSADTYQIIDGRAIARRIQEDVEKGVSELIRKDRQPHLVAIQVGDNEATKVYVTRQKERFAGLGMRFDHHALDASTTKRSLAEHIEYLNRSPSVTGIILTMPLPDEIQAFEAQELIHPEKDVEGVNPANLGRLIYNRHAVGPCTALAVMEAIDETGIELKGKNVVIVGHSDIVGKPVGLCLLRELATITTCHVATRNLRAHCLEADILIVAVGKPGLISGDMVKSGAVVIDVGINRSKDGGIIGDVDFENVAPHCSWITPVPGGIGPITVAMLARNTLICAQKTLNSDLHRRMTD